MKTIRLISALAATLLSAAITAMAQVPIEESTYAVTYIAPAYFGPYAFPVPDMLAGEVGGKLRAELGMDCAVGTVGGKDARDITLAPTFKVCVPLWTERVNLSIYGELHEFYNDTPQARLIRRVSSVYPLMGNDSGNLYVSTSFLVLREGQFYPSVALRATLQTATGDHYEKARHYDAPGYFFDASIGKTFDFGDAGVLHIGGDFGFVCWQIDRGRQNDAWLLGAKASYSFRFLTLNVEYGQYSGWGRLDRKKNPSLSPGDCPKTIKGRLDFHIGRFSPFVFVCHGLNDYPFTIYKAGLAVDFDILKK